MKVEIPKSQMRRKREEKDHDELSSKKKAKTLHHATSKTKMHPRNKYLIPPNFKLMSEIDEQFAPL